MPKNFVTPLNLDLVISRYPCMNVRFYLCTFSAGGKGVLFSLCHSSVAYHHVPVFTTQWLDDGQKGDFYIVRSSE